MREAPQRLKAPADGRLDDEVRPWLRAAGALRPGGRAGGRHAAGAGARRRRRRPGGRRWPWSRCARRSRASRATVGKGVLDPFLDRAAKESAAWTGADRGDGDGRTRRTRVRLDRRPARRGGDRDDRARGAGVGRGAAGGACPGRGLAQARPAVGERLDPGRRQGPAGGRACGSRSAGDAARGAVPVRAWCPGSPTSRRPGSISYAARRTPRSAAARSGPGVRLTARRPGEVRGALTAKAPAGIKVTVPKETTVPRGRADDRAGRGHRPGGHPGRASTQVPLSLRRRGAHADGAGLPAHRAAPTSRAPRARRLLVRRRDARLPGRRGDRRRPGDPLVLARRGRRLVAAGAGPPGPARARWCCTGRTRTRRGTASRSRRTAAPGARRRRSRTAGAGASRSAWTPRTPASSGSRATRGPRSTATRSGRWRRTRWRSQATAAPGLRGERAPGRGTRRTGARAPTKARISGGDAVDPGHRVVRAVRLQVRQPARVPMAGPDDAPGQTGGRGGFVAQPPADLDADAGRP